MKQIVFVAFFLLVFSGSVLSQPEQGPEQGEGKEDVKTVQPPKKAEQGSQKPEEHQWPLPFVPSEEVGADSVISFPTDI